MYLLKVEGMTCRGCVDGVNKSIKSIDLAAEVGVDLLKKEIKVQTDKSLEEVCNILEESGYTVVEVIQ